MIRYMCQTPIKELFTIFILDGHDSCSLIWIHSNRKWLLYIVAGLKYDREILWVFNLEICIDGDAHSLL